MITEVACLRTSVFSSQFHTIWSATAALLNTGKRQKEEAHGGIASSPKLDMADAWLNSFAAVLLCSIIRIPNCHHNCCHSSPEATSFNIISISLYQRYLIAAAEVTMIILAWNVKFHLCKTLYLPHPFICKEGVMLDGHLTVLTSMLLQFFTCA